MLKRAFQKILCFILVAAVCVTPAFALDFGFDIDEPLSECVYLVCRDTGQVVYEKNPDVRITPASTTKIMSAALAMTLCGDLDATVVSVPDNVWDEFAGLDVSSCGLVGGEELTMRELLYCMLIPSANEAASVMASYFGFDNFILLMNEKAKELGCTNTHFTNPHGVFTTDHYTTARDMYLITEWALTVPGFWEITQQSEFTLRATNKCAEERTFYATNKMQEPTSGYYTSYVKGVKTGSLESGRYLVSAAQKDGLTHILVLLGAPLESSARFWGSGVSTYTDTRLIYEWAYKNLTLESAVTDTVPVSEINVKYAAKRDTLILYPGDDIYTLVNVNNTEEPTVEYIPNVPEYIEAPITAGDAIGEAEVIYNGENIGTIPLVSKETIEFSRFSFVMENLAAIFTSKTAKIIYLIILLIVLFYVWYMKVLVPRQKRKKKRRQSR